ncbi:alpha/beta fold hydrolase [Schumannella soli]|uniref:Alpha/beta hydrolase n=1 Tax=Schumannella soli TaxID=2590779 RepID=A0A506XZD6_9MICO|nr:alpha/beta hydrolase [Schumannella soli]TPW75576.1 alpha/beta hydrolase [Schumannella soli]
MLGRRDERQLAVSIDEGRGRVVVLVHGIASSSVTFQNLVPLLTPNHRVIAIDLLGFGRSPAPADAEYTVAEHVDAIARAIDRLHLRAPFTLVGHSLGTILGARYAATHPRRVRHLVMVSPPLYVDPAQLGDPLLRARVSVYLQLYKFVRENQAFTLRNARLVERMLPIPKAMDINVETWVPFIKSLENCIESQTTITDLVNTPAPVDILVGALDEFHVPGSLDGLARLSNVTTRVVPGNDHLIRESMARQVAAAIDPA